jgi:N-sulfoglucosamine sulfohydrolase
MPKRSDACPMRGIQDRDFLYIFNAWSYSDAIYYNNNEGITMQAMQQAAKIDESIAERVQLFRIRPVEEFYDLRNDPNCLMNIIDDGDSRAALDTMKIALEGWMKEMNDPLLSVFINRNKPDLVREKLYALYPALKELGSVASNQE